MPVKPSRLYLLTLLLAVCLSVSGAALASPAATIKIMPLGDSITESSDGYASYRYWLWHQLVGTGQPADFVGSQFGVYGGDPLYPDFDQDHEGHWGWRADQILANIDDWAGAAQPDVVLVHLGHNDLWQGQSVESTIDELSQIIDALRATNPSVKILLAQIIPSTAVGLEAIPDFNAQIPALASQKSTPASPVIVVDQFTGFDADADTWDGVHPDESGEKKMAARWFDALANALSIPRHRVYVPVVLR